ncbi:MAG TPA: hypothetical protein VN213_20965 [Solirubrobacteraceae bacterium]|nr:hypothetical protein [Solirubrobacteraceae bacterium]
MAPAGLVIGCGGRDGPAQLARAAPADLLGGAQRLLGGRGVAAEHVASTGDLQHHGGQGVADEVVDVACDPGPLDQQRLPRRLAAAGLELGDEPGLACGRSPEGPRKAISTVQIPVDISG